MYKLKLSFVYLIVLLVFSSCKTQMQIEKPRESYLPSTISPAMSEFPLQLDIDIKKLETAINKKMNGLLFEENNMNNQDISVKVWKAQNFTFKITNNVIEYRVPLKVWSRFAWKVQKFGYTVSDHYEANGSIALTYKTTISIDRNWKLIAKTSSSGFQWIETPKLNLIGINVPVTPIANLALSKSDKLITEEIDKALAEMVDLKKYVSMAWVEAQEPMKINDANNLWLRITPKDINVSPFTTTGQKLNLAISIYAQIETFMGAEPKKNALIALPPLKFVQRPPQQFNLNIATDATYDKISEIVKSQLINKTFSEGNKSITITDISIFGSGGRAVVVTDVIGSLKGRIYFSGIMVYNAEKKAIEIQNSEFDVNTKNALVKSASWLMKGLILKKMTPYLTYSVQKDLDDLKLEANKSISNYKVSDGIFLQGKLNSVEVNSLDLVPGAVRITTNVKGNVNVKIDDLQF